MTCFAKALCKYLWKLSLLTLFWSCDTPTAPPARGFIYWKTGWDSHPAIEEYFHALPAERLWFRLFDVDRTQESGLIAPVGIWTGPLPPVAPELLEPVVFLTVRSLETANATEIQDLAGKITRLVQKLMPGKLRSLWLDCDWTPSTQAAYFDLLGHLRATLPAGVRVGSTLRMHQWAYPKATGVPPADEVLLMAYNTGEVTDTNTVNSIIDPENLDRWRPASSYPLPLSIALPTWSWGVVFREGSWWQLIQPLDAHLLKDTALFQRMPGTAPWFAVKKGTFLHGHYLSPGDRIRVEHADIQALKQTADWFRKQLHTAPSAIAFYHLHLEQTQKYPIDTLRDILDRFQQ